LECERWPEVEMKSSSFNNNPAALLREKKKKKRLKTVSMHTRGQSAQTLSQPNEHMMPG